MVISEFRFYLTYTGWRPKRTIVLLSWGAEEPQYMGSVEWLEVKENLFSISTYQSKNLAIAVPASESQLKLRVNLAKLKLLSSVIKL